LRSLDPDVPAFEIRSMKRAFDREIATPRLPAVLTTVFGALATLLAGLGLFGVIAYWVSQRTRELGIRSALGAQARDLRALVIRQGGQLALTGAAAGLVGAASLARLLRSLLHGMSERDFLVYASVVALTVVTTLLACWLPARRAARIDPAVALRDEG
jgi:putative ABC transport system permease protein